MSVFHTRLVRKESNDGDAVYSVQSFDFSSDHTWEEIAEVTISLKKRAYAFVPGIVWRRERILPPSFWELSESERQLQYEKFWRPRDFGLGRYAQLVSTWSRMFIEQQELPNRWPEVFFEGESAETLTMREFQAPRERYFDALCQKIGLINISMQSGSGFAVVSASLGNVRVFLEYERGLCSFAVGPASETSPLCAVEEIARRFPRVRSMTEGVQRLSLDEQKGLIEEKWADLQVMFSPEHLPETRRWHEAAAAEYTKRFTKPPS